MFQLAKVWDGVGAERIDKGPLLKLLSVLHLLLLYSKVRAVWFRFDHLFYNVKHSSSVVLLVFSQSLLVYNSFQ